MTHAAHDMPTLRKVLTDLAVEGELYERLDDGRLLCYACGHECRVADGRTGVCRVRYNEAGRLMVPHGYVGALACDPIEKKPFFHAFPGRDALSFGMLGCDLHCSYCQNWITSQALRDDRALADAQAIAPDQLVELAARRGVPVIASTYNEPLITTEWAVDVFRRANARGIRGAYISNGNATRRVLQYLRPHADLYKIDLKSFRDKPYRQLGGQLHNVLRTIEQCFEMGFWVEIVTLIVPGLNDDEAELREMADFLAAISPDIPWHVTAFHADYKMADQADTRDEQIVRAAEIGADAGLHFVYAGNRPGRVGRWEDTRCPGCGATLIERRGFIVHAHHLDRGRCPQCTRPIPGVWADDCRIPQQPA